MCLTPCGLLYWQFNGKAPPTINQPDDRVHLSPAVHRGDHAADLVLFHFAKAGNCNNFPGQTFGFLQPGGVGNAIGGLLMIGYRIMDIRGNSMRLQMPAEAVAVAATNHEEVGDIICPEIAGKFDAWIPDPF